MSDYDPPFWRWHVWRGNNPPFTFQVAEEESGDPVDLSGMSLRLRVSWAGGSIALNSGEAGFTILPQTGEQIGQFEITFTLAQTRLLPDFPNALFEIEQRIDGEEVTWIEGEIVCSGGVNTDG